MINPLHRQKQCGFTLVEMIVVIVITGILGGIVAVFMRTPIQMYVDGTGRAELSDIADLSVRRMAREIRLAVPNSVRVRDGTVVEFVPTKAGGRYLATEDGQPAANPVLDFHNAANLDFTVVGNMPTGRQAIKSGDFIVVFNAGTAPGNVYSVTPGAMNRATVGAVNGSVVSLLDNPFSAQEPRLPHPASRFLVANQPVSFACAGGSLLRYTGYGFSADQALVPGGTQTVLATNVVSCNFNYSVSVGVNAALLTMTLVLERASGRDGPITLTQQVHVENTP